MKNSLQITIGDDRISLLRRETATYHHPLNNSPTIKSLQILENRALMPELCDHKNNDHESFRITKRI